MLFALSESVSASAGNVLMEDVFSPEKRSWIMRQVRSRYNVSTELRFIALMKEFGISGWRRGYPLSGSPDFVFRLARIAVFIDGCFWHGCSLHCRMPSSNRDYWQGKIERNKRRDREVSRLLKAKGWTAFRFWEHDLKPKSLNRRKIRRLSSLLGADCKSCKPLQGEKLRSKRQSS